VEEPFGHVAGQAQPSSDLSADAVADPFVQAHPPSLAHDHAAIGRQRSSHICYDRRMADVASRELRNETRSVLARVESGEDVVITVDGRPVATIKPLPDRQRWMPRDEFATRIGSHQADSGLAAELAELAPDSTDDLSDR
jgi:prevent-host-death family protein